LNREEPCRAAKSHECHPGRSREGTKRSKPARP
jgi:hypothetical protein